MIRTVIAEDHPLLRAYIRRYLARLPRVVVVGEAQNGAEALELLAREQPDLLVLDIEMPVLDGVELARRAPACSPRTRILVLSSHNEPAMIAALRELGVSAYLVKDEAPAALAPAIAALFG